MVYRRYVCTPKQLWEWFEPLMEDNEPLKAGRMMDDTPMCVRSARLALVHLR